MTLPVEVKVFEDDNTTEVCSLTHDADPANVRQVRSLSGKRELLGAGDGELAVDFDHPQLAELTGGRFVQVIEGGGVKFSFRIQRDRVVTIPPPGGSDADRIVTVSGRGPRDILRLGRVLPWMAVGSVPLSTRRRFDWSSPGLDTSDWTTPYVQDRTTSEPGKPFGIPSLFNTKWIWGEAEADDMTIGDCVFRRKFTLADAATVSFFTSADDRFSDCLQSVEMQSVQPPFPAKVWHTPYRSPVALDAGTYVYGIRASNDGGKGAVMCDAWTTTLDAGLGDQVFMSGLPGETPPGAAYDFLYGEDDEAWLCFMDPAGEWWTPGEILRILLEECQARGELLDVTLDFDDTLDSAGNAWPKVEAEFSATGTFLDAVEVLEDSGHIDAAMSDTGLVLSAWNKDPGRGTATAINASYVDREVQSDATETDYDIANDVLLVHDRGMYLYESPLSVLAYGRRPGGSLQVGSISDPVILDQIGAAYLTGKTNPAPSRVVETVSTFDLDCDPGDTITVEGDTLRVTEIAYSLDRSGELRKVPVLSTEYQEYRKRAERTLDRLIRENGEGSRASARIIYTGTQIEPGPIDPVELESWSWTEGDDLVAELWDTDRPRPWQTHVVKKACRLVALIVECDWADPDGSGGLTAVATGDTSIKLIINDLPTVVPFVATVPSINPTDSSNPKVWAIQYILGEALLNPLDRVSVAVTEAGAHVNGSAALWAVDAS